MAVKPLERKPLSCWERTYIPQIIGGLRVTLRNLLRPKVTLEYPEQRAILPLRYRGAPTLVRDATGREKCVSCQLCEFVCPPKAIRITPGAVLESAPDAHVEKAPASFEINMLRCIFCGLCQEVCPEAAIHLQKHFSITGLSPTAFIHDKQKLYAMGGTLPGASKQWPRAHDAS
ncbi:MAG: NADH-quinone oxidoreductase subunit I [Puniceicoccales bacterium]|jgi:NADH-quinone oxidoreductase subunit I|nr:NADH-quinone oxidoreductase subunit I [Puniceicoccales bacterium]